MVRKVNVLVTGGTGFVGKHVQEAFKSHAENYDVVFPGLEENRYFDLTDEWDVFNLFQVYSPDIIIHMAAACGGILANKNNPARFLTDNLKMGLNIYEQACGTSVRYIYSLGSICMYPKHCSVPFNEDDLFAGYPEETNAPYGVAKRALFMMSQSYRKQYGIGGAFLMPVNMYGPHDHFDLENSHVIPALINKFTDAVMNKKDTVCCWGTGSATREFLYAGDLAEALVKTVINTVDTDQPINIGTGKDISIKDLAHLIAELTGFDGKIEFTGDVSDGQPERRLDVSRAKEILNFEAKTPLLEGLKKTISWYQSQL